MNILILSWRGPKHPTFGGAEISTHEHAKGWVNAGNRVVLFTSYFPNARREEIIDGVEIKRYGKQMFGVQWEALVWYLFKSQVKFDLVIDQFHGIPFFTPFYVRAKKLGFIHEVAKEVWHLNPWPKPYNYFPSIFGRLLEPLIFLFYRATPFMTVSESTKEDLIKWGIPSKNITVIHNGVNIPAKLKRFEKEKTPTLIFLGAISQDKGIEDALRVFSIVQKKNELSSLWVVGKAEETYLAKLKKLCIELEIERKVIFFDYVSEIKKFELLSKAHILINTSVREGWGLVVIEAASVGTPTVGYNVPGLKDSIIQNKTGILSDANPKSCADAIDQLLYDKKMYESFKKNCLQRAKEFNWKDSSRISLKLIASLVG